MKHIINEAFDYLHDGSLPTIEMLQTSFPDNKDLMINISTLFDPRYVFLIYAPILFAINKRVGHRMIISLTIAEWMNQVLKWLLAGERPYWYVEEQRIVPALNVSSTWPQLKQFPVTCELGAGSPSGHAMVTASVWFVLIDAYHKGELSLSGSTSGSPTSGYSTLPSLAKVSWTIYSLMLVSVSLSRVYLACHFPHQCLGGAFLGLLVAWFVCERLPIERLRKRHFVLLTAFMFASALATYASLKVMGFNPLWSVEKGLRWCVKKEYIHLDTTPFFSMMRYLGFCLGCGLAFNGAAYQAGLSEAREPQLARRIASAVMSILFGQFLLALPAPKSNLNVFYLISFLIYTTFSFASAAPIPKACRFVAEKLARPTSQPNKAKVH